MATWLSKFLKRPTNCTKVIIKGKRVNRGGGYGLDVPCEDILEGDSFSSGWLQAKLIKEVFDVHCGGPSKPKQNHSYTVLCISCCVWTAVERNWTWCAYHRVKIS